MTEKIIFEQSYTSGHLSRAGVPLSAMRRSKRTGICSSGTWDNPMFIRLRPHDECLLRPAPRKKSSRRSAAGMRLRPDSNSKRNFCSRSSMSRNVSLHVVWWWLRHFLALSGLPKGSSRIMKLVCAVCIYFIIIRRALFNQGSTR
jgi:hypothetical protein